MCINNLLNVSMIFLILILLKSIFSYDISIFKEKYNILLIISILILAVPYIYKRLNNPNIEILLHTDEKSNLKKVLQHIRLKLDSIKELSTDCTKDLEFSDDSFLEKVEEVEELTNSDPISINPIKPNPPDNVKPQPDNVKPHLGNVKPPPDNVKPHLDNVKPPPDNVKPHLGNVKPEPDNVKPQPDNVKPQPDNVNTINQSQLKSKHIIELNDECNMHKELSKRYFNFLSSDLIKHKILDKQELLKIEKKLNLNIITLEDAIKSFEELQKLKINNDISGELEDGFYKPIGNDIANEWSSQYAILNTDKWKVPIKRPPICLSNNNEYWDKPNEKLEKYVLLDNWNTEKNIFNRT